ncbi:MAG: DUF1501 domain-containing protein [Acidobacteriota bacterium]|nr:DUF1501 domain-containing protein [Acidobacteriota bacterium]
MANKYYKQLNEVNAPRGITSPLTGPVLGRREFFKLGGLGLSGMFLSSALKAEAATTASAVVPPLIGRARNCIFILATGAPSNTDTFDLKVGAWTPSDFNATPYNGVMFPQGLMPKLAEQMNKFAIVRSMRAPALVHPLQQTWAQIARSPSSALGKIAPNLGSVVASEFESKRTANQKLPGFISLNTGGNVVGPGYFNGLYSPFDVTAAPTGLGSLSNTDGQVKFEARYEALKSLDSKLRINSTIGDDATTMGSFYDRGKTMMYDPAVDAVFKFTTEEQVRYGNNSFGNSCIVARNAVKSNQGARFIQVQMGGWDHHQDIYAKSETPNQTVPGIYAQCTGLDFGVSNLLTDLANEPGVNGGTLLDETLVVWMGEFGRTVGPLTNQDGRDHYFQHFACFAGGGVSGGKIIGQTSDTGGSVVDPGWSAGRAAQYEDVAATIYSALGIDYTTIKHDDPYGRGFEYVPFATEGYWQPINELFSRSSTLPRTPIGPRDSGRRIG